MFSEKKTNGLQINSGLYSPISTPGIREGEEDQDWGETHREESPTATQE